MVMGMNEATFEAVLNGVVKKLFPFGADVNVKHQVSFTLQLGHHPVSIDGKLKEAARGRLDVLLSVQNRPALLLELKAPGLKLLPGDFHQARSYACLCDPMPPLFGVTNGDDCELRRTYDGAVFESLTIDDKSLASLLADVTRIAAHDQDAAVKALLGRNPKWWAEVVASVTSDAVDALSGRATDLACPIASDFQFDRDCARQISDALVSGKPVVALVGPPASGKTNILAQVCRDLATPFLPLLVDASSLSEGIWQHIANAFSLRLFRAMGADEAREWVRSMIGREVGEKLVVVIDGWQPSNSFAVRAEFDELVRFAAKTDVRVVVSLDRNDFEFLSAVPNRNTRTLFGNTVCEVPIARLSDDDFERACSALAARSAARFLPGAAHNPELRSPISLRMIAATLPLRSLPPTPQPEQNLVSGLTISPMIGPQYLRQIWSKLTISGQDRLDLLGLAEASLDALRLTREAVVLRIQSDYCVLPFEPANQRLGVDGVARLKARGIVGETRHRQVGDLLICRVPELLAEAGAQVAAMRCRADSDVDYAEFLRLTASLPFSDVAGASALGHIGDRDADLALAITSRLLCHPPESGTLSAGDETTLVTADFAPNLTFGEGVEERTVGNLHPYLILSQVALAYPIGSGDFSFVAQIFKAVGAADGPLRLFEMKSLEDVTRLLMHELPTGESFVCHAEGFVEPITLALYNSILEFPGEMVRFAGEVIGPACDLLVWRMLVAASHAQHSVDAIVAKAAKQILDLSTNYWTSSYGGLGVCCPGREAGLDE